jgi:hypothetical protein
MTDSMESYAAWLADCSGADQTLSERYLGEPAEMLNADQATEVVNGLLAEFAQANGAQLGSGDQWSFVRGGMTMVEIQHGDDHLKVERFCGGWRLASDKTAQMLAKLDHASHVTH